MSDEPTTLIAAGAAVVVGALSSLVTFLASRRPGKAAEVTAEAALQTALAAGFEKLTVQYDRANSSLVAKVTALEGAVNGLSQHIYSLEEILRENGHTIPERPVHAQWPPPEFKLLEGGKP